MRFLLLTLLVFVSVFVSAQAPPMSLGGPQGVNVKRILMQDWMSVPIYVDTPASPLTGSGWPGSGYVIQAIKNYRDATVEDFLDWQEAAQLTQLDSIRWQDNKGTIYYLPNGIDSSQVLDYLLYGDTSLWHYTGKRWRRVGGNAELYFNYLLDGGFVTQLSPASSRLYSVSPAEYFISGIKYKYDTSFRLQAPPKAADSTGRIDVITITSTGPRLIKGTPSRTPFKPRVNPNEIELSTIYFRPFDTIPNIIGGSNGSAITTIYRVPGKDSIFYTVDTLTFKIKDSIGISKNDTAAMLNPYKFTAANGLTKDSTVFRLGGSLNQNTSINLNTRRLTFIGGSDTTRMYQNGSLSIGGTPDSSSIHWLINKKGSRLGNLEILSNQNSATTGNGIRIDGVEQTFKFQGSNAPNTAFQFSNWTNDTTPAGLFATSKDNIRINLGFRKTLGVSGDTLQGNVLNIMPKYNVSYDSGITTLRGIYYNPTIQALNKTTHIAYQNTTGSNILNSTSGNTRIGYSTNDTTYKLDVNGNTMVRGILRLQPTSPSNAAIIMNQNSNDGSLVWGANNLNLPSNFGARNVIISPSGIYNTLTGAENVLIGRSTGNSLTSGIRNTFVGNNTGNSITTGVNNTFIGASDGWSNLSSSTSNSIQIVGGGHEANRSDSVLLGLSSRYAFIGGGGFGSYINDYYFGGGNRVGFPNDAHINFYAPSGFPTKADTIGSNFTINAGRGTGNGRGGSLIFRTSPTTTPGTTLQTLQNRLIINNAGNVLINRDSSYIGIGQIGIPRLDVNGDVNVSGILNFSPSTNENQIKITSNRLLVGGASTQQGLIAIGSYSATNLTSTGGSGLVALGGGAGFDLTSGGRYSIMIGRAAGRGITTGENNTIISSGDALNIPSSTSNAIHLIAGAGYESNNADTVLLGLTSRYAFIGGGYGFSNYVRDYYFGGGHRVRFPNDTHVNFYAPSGYPTATDTIGSNFTINAGRGTGAGIGGSIIFRTSPATTSGTTLQTLEERVRISHRGNLLVGTATDDTSSLVNIVSTSKGFLQPRMTNTQRDAITTPATGLQLFSTTDSANYVYRGTGGGWQKIANEISGSASLNFPSTNNGSKSDLTITGVTGATVGDVVSLGVPHGSVLDHSCYTAWVSANGEITVRFNNYGSGNLDPAEGTFKIKVFK